MTHYDCPVESDGPTQAVRAAMRSSTGSMSSARSSNVMRSTEECEFASSKSLIRIAPEGRAYRAGRAQKTALSQSNAGAILPKTARAGLRLGRISAAWCRPPMPAAYLRRARQPTTRASAITALAAATIPRAVWTAPFHALGHSGPPTGGRHHRPAPAGRCLCACTTGSPSAPAVLPATSGARPFVRNDGGGEAWVDDCIVRVTARSRGVKFVYRARRRGAIWVPSAAAQAGIPWRDDDRSTSRRDPTAIGRSARRGRQASSGAGCARQQRHFSTRPGAGPRQALCSSGARSRTRHDRCFDQDWRCSVPVGGDGGCAGGCVVASRAAGGGWRFDSAAIAITGSARTDEERGARGAVRRQGDDGR